MRAFAGSLQVVALVGTLTVGVVARGADRVADAVVPRLAAPLHRPRVEAVPERRADDRRPGRQPVVRRRSSATSPSTCRASAWSRSRPWRSTTASSSSSRRASCSTRSSSYEPVIQLERDGEAGTSTRLVKKQEREADREGAARADVAAVDRDRRRDTSRSTIRSAPAAIVCRGASTISTEGGVRVRAGSLLGRRSITSASARRRRSSR